LGPDVPPTGVFYSDEENQPTYSWGFGEQDPNDPNSVTPVGVTPASPYSGRPPAGAPGAIFYGTNPGGTSSPYLFVINPRKIIVPVTRQFASYNLKSFANVMDYGVAYPAAAAVATPVVGAGLLAGGTTYLANPGTVAVVGTGALQFISPSGPQATLPSVTAFWINYLVNRYVYPIGP
jgi:hypothetical protein